MAGERQFKAFVSSTFLDLRNHRAHAIGALRRSRIHVDPMEDWPADAEEPRRFCLERISGCDLCLLLVAFRRGFVPNGEALSITQLEYEYARSHGTAVLVFLLDDDAPWPRKFDEMHADPGIREWREQLKLTHGIGTFNLTPESLDVVPAVMRWMQERAGAPTPPAPGLVSPFDFTPYLESKRRHFVGREWLFKEIGRWREKRPERALLLVGDPGVGKSAVVAELIHRNPVSRVLAYHCCRADNPATLQPGLIVRALAAQTAERFPAYAELLADRAAADALEETHSLSNPMDAFERGLLNPLYRMPPPQDGPFCLLFDALDETLAGGEAGRGLGLIDLLAARLDQFPRWLRVLATTRGERPVLDRLRGLRAWELDARDPQNLHDIERYLRQRLAEPPLDVRVSESGRPLDEVVRVLCAKSEGNFLYAQQALETLEQDPEQMGRLEALPPGLAGLYLRFFQGHFADEVRSDRTKRLLQVVAAAREPLAEPALAEATGLDDEEELPGVLRSLSAYLPRRGPAGGEMVVTIYHQSLAEWLTDPSARGSPYYVSRRMGHRALAEHCRKEYRDLGQAVSRYTLRHLPAHLAGARSWPKLVELLTDLRFLQAKSEAGLVFELAADFTRAVAAMPPGPGRQVVELLEEALRLDINFLARHPSALFQCLWNRCWWFDGPEAGLHYALGAADTGPLTKLAEPWRQEKPSGRWLRLLRPPPHHLGTALRRVFSGHRAELTAAAYAPDGRRAATASRDGTVRLWDVDSGAELLELAGHTGDVNAVAFSPGGSRLASAGADGTVIVRNSGSGTEMLRLAGHEGAVWSVAFSPDGNRLASGSWDGSVRVWDLTNGAEVLRLTGHKGGVNCVAYSPDGARIAAGGLDQTIRLWDAATGKPLDSPLEHRGRVHGLAFSPDGTRLASATSGRVVRVWDVAADEYFDLEGHTANVNGVAFSPEGRLASASSDGTVRLWDIAARAERRVLRGHDRWVNGIVFSGDGRQVLSCSSDKTARIWNAEGGIELRSLCGHADPVRCLAFSPEGRFLASAASAGEIWLWDAATGKPLMPLTGHGDGIASLAFSPDGALLASGSVDASVRLWNAGSGEAVRCLRGQGQVVNRVAFSADGRLLASASDDETLCVWDVATGAELCRLSGHEDAVLSALFLPGGWRVASASEDCTVRLWDAIRGMEVACLQGHEAPVRCLAMSHDGRRLLSGSDDGTVRVWDALSGAVLQCLRGPEGLVESVALARDGGLAFAASREGTVRVWDVESGDCREVLPGVRDLAALAAGSGRFPFRAVSRGLETAVEESSTGAALAWLPLALDAILTHPSGRTWAGVAGPHLCLFALADS